MKRSLEVFQAEWYEMQQSGKFKALPAPRSRFIRPKDSELAVVPDVYTRNHGFQQEAKSSERPESRLALPGAAAS